MPTEKCYDGGTNTMDKLTLEEVLSLRHILSDYGGVSHDKMMTGFDQLAEAMRENERLWNTLVEIFRGHHPDSEDKNGEPYTNQEIREIAANALYHHPNKHSVKDDAEHCPVCHWPMAKTMEQGCVPGNCSYRPRGKG